MQCGGCGFSFLWCREGGWLCMFLFLQPSQTPSPVRFFLQEGVSSLSSLFPAMMYG
jgi:hypothetical protein